MSILLDECTPRVVKTRLPQRAIATVQEMGWAGIVVGLLPDLERALDAIQPGALIQLTLPA